MNDVEIFVEQLNIEWQKQKCKELLAIQQQANTNIEMEIKWGNPYFSYNGKALLKWYCANDWINIYFFRGTGINDSNNLFIETNNKKMRTIKIFADTNIDGEGYLNLIRQALNLNKL